MTKRAIDALEVDVDAAVSTDGSGSVPVLAPAAVPASPPAIDVSVVATTPLSSPPPQALTDANSDPAGVAAALAAAAAAATVATAASMMPPPVEVPLDTTSAGSGSTIKRQKKGNIFLTNEQRQALCIRAATEKATQTQLCFWAKDEFGLNGPLNQSTVSRILAEKDKYIAIEGSTLGQKRKTHVEHPALEAALSHWLLVSSHNNQRLQGDLIKEKGRAFARMLGIESKISFSNGWLTGFKKRHAMILASASNDAAAPATAAAPMTSAMGGDSDAAAVGSASAAAAVDFGLWSLQQVVQEYNARDVFSVDETGLFFAMMPEKTQRRGSGSGTKGTAIASVGAATTGATVGAAAAPVGVTATKAPKEKLTLLLAVNADGSERLDPVFIGRSRHLARASPGVAGIATKKEQLQLQLQLQFVKTDADVPFHYCYSDRPWLNAVVFQRWLNTLNSQMKIANRHILVLLDDAPSHVMRGLKLTNIRVLMLDRTTVASAAQPFDAGITLAFKRRYRKRQMVHAFDRLEAGDNDIYSVDEVQAMKWCRAAWHDVPKDVIVKSWLQSHLFGESLVQPDAAADLDSTEDELDQAIKDISYKLPLKRVMALKELLSPPDECDDLHFVGVTEADFLAVQEELPSFQHSSSNSNDEAMVVASGEASAVFAASDTSVAVDLARAAATGSTVSASAAHGSGVLADLRVGEPAAPLLATSNVGRAASSDALREDSQLPDEDLLLYVQKIVPNLERLGCDERTIQALRDVRQALKQRLTKSKTASTGATAML